MTLKGFSIKYGVPYNIVYESSYKVKSVPTLQRDRDYPEHDLYIAVGEVLMKRIERHSEIAKRQLNYLNKMNEVGKKKWSTDRD